jgi:hypothetical protein
VSDVYLGSDQQSDIDMTALLVWKDMVRGGPPIRVHLPPRERARRRWALLELALIALRVPLDDPRITWMEDA